MRSVIRRQMRLSGGREPAREQHDLASGAQWPRRYRLEFWVPLFIIVVAAAAGELALRTAFGFPLPMVNFRADDRLLFTAHPAFPDIDDRGFRRTPVSGDYRIAAIGDSHTFGYNVDADKSWPSLLARDLRVPIYNYGVSGYNFLHYYTLSHEALRAGMDVIIALYPANDLTQFICELYHLDGWADERARLGVPLDCHDRPLRGSFLPVRPPEERTLAASIKEWTVGNVATASIVYHLIWRPARMALTASPAGTVVYPEGIDDPGFERFDVQLFDMFIASTRRDGGFVSRSLDVSLVAFDQLISEARARDRFIGVLMVRSRPRIIAASYGDARNHLDRRFADLVRQEDQLVERYIEFFEDRGVAVVDNLAFVTDAYEQARGERKAFWPVADDDHPLADGYVAYADAVKELLRSAPQWREQLSP
jgi:lysophospholipase L1-like esterase